MHTLAIGAVQIVVAAVIMLLAYVAYDLLYRSVIGERIYLAKLHEQLRHAILSHGYNNHIYIIDPDSSSGDYIACVTTFASGLHIYYYNIDVIVPIAHDEHDQLVSVLQSAGYSLLLDRDIARTFTWRINFDGGRSKLESIDAVDSFTHTLERVVRMIKGHSSEGAFIKYKVKIDAALSSKSAELRKQLKRQSKDD